MRPRHAFDAGRLSSRSSQTKGEMRIGDPKSGRAWMRKIAYAVLVLLAVSAFVWLLYKMTGSIAIGLACALFMAGYMVVVGAITERSFGNDDAGRLG